MDVCGMVGGSGRADNCDEKVNGYKGVTYASIVCGGNFNNAIIDSVLLTAEFQGHTIIIMKDSKFNN